MASSSSSSSLSSSSSSAAAPPPKLTGAAKAADKAKKDQEVERQLEAIRKENARSQRMRMSFLLSQSE